MNPLEELLRGLFSINDVDYEEEYEKEQEEGYNFYEWLDTPKHLSNLHHGEAKIENRIEDNEIEIEH